MSDSLARTNIEAFLGIGKSEFYRLQEQGIILKTAVEGEGYGGWTIKKGISLRGLDSTKEELLLAQAKNKRLENIRLATKIFLEKTSLIPIDFFGECLGRFSEQLIEDFKNNATGKKQLKKTIQLLDENLELLAQMLEDKGEEKTQKLLSEAVQEC